VGYPVGQVDVPGLLRTGTAVEQTAASFGKAHAGAADALAPGAGRGGWATTAALANSCEAWGGFLQQLTGQVRALGAGLASSARAYQAADQASAARVAAAGAGSGGGIPAGHPATARAQDLPL
jgi:hypothetical protein